MKRIICILCVLVLFLSPSMIHADLITGPSDDDFYQDHQKEVFSLVRIFEAQRDIDVVSSPESDDVLGVIEKGRIILVEFYYVDESGDAWGMQRMDDDTGAWFKMKYMTRIKDYIDFWDEHHNKDSKEIIRFEEDGYMILWEYPNSGIIASAPHTSVTHRDEYPIQAGVEYVDEKGVRWLSVAIDFRTYIGWLNMDDPICKIQPKFDDRRIHLDENFDPSKYDFSESIFDLYGKELLIGTLVISVCVFTGVLTVLKRKRL